MRIDEESLALYSTESSRHLDIQAKLEAQLSLSSTSEATDLDNFSQPEDHIQEVILRVICLHIAHIWQLTHQKYALSLLTLG